MGVNPRRNGLGWSTNNHSGSHPAIARGESALPMLPTLVAPAAIRVVMDEPEIRIACAVPDGTGKCACDRCFEPGASADPKARETVPLHGHVLLSASALRSSSSYPAVVSVTFSGTELMDLRTRPNAIPTTTEFFSRTVDLLVPPTASSTTKLAFSMNLPTWLPPSAQTTSCRLHYLLTAEMKIGDAPPRDATEVLVVRSHVAPATTTPLPTTVTMPGTTLDAAFEIDVRAPARVALAPGVAGAAVAADHATVALAVRAAVEGVAVRGVSVGVFEARRYRYRAHTVDGVVDRHEIEMVPVGDPVRARMAATTGARATVRVRMPRVDDVGPAFRTRSLRVYHVLGVTVSYVAAVGGGGVAGGKTGVALAPPAAEPATGALSQSRGTRSRSASPFPSFLRGSGASTPPPPPPPPPSVSMPPSPPDSGASSASEDAVGGDRGSGDAMTTSNEASEASETETGRRSGRGMRFWRGLQKLVAGGGAGAVAGGEKGIMGLTRKKESGFAAGFCLMVA
ncbi:hypothetical protein HDU96_008143 [Phlyctochytrium bullatum]|nr:hypothetical protein HDU96_008143 [Phlyctochytrium bullatum]